MLDDESGARSEEGRNQGQSPLGLAFVGEEAIRRIEEDQAEGAAQARQDLDDVAADDRAPIGEAEIGQIGGEDTNGVGSFVDEDGAAGAAGQSLDAERPRPGIKIEDSVAGYIEGAAAKGVPRDVP